MGLFKSASTMSFVILALPAIGSAEVIEGFNLTGDGFVTSASLPLAPTTSDPNVSAGTLGISANYGAGPVQRTDYVGPDAIATDTSASPIYLAFSVKPNAGQTISVSALNADVVIQNPQEVDILTSTDGSFADAVKVASLPSPGDWSGIATTFDLSSVAALQDIPDSQTTTFFLDFTADAYNDRGINEKSSTFANGDALEIVGTVSAAVPEPASLGLIGIAAGSFLIRRRRPC